MPSRVGNVGEETGEEVETEEKAGDPPAGEGTGEGASTKGMAAEAGIKAPEFQEDDEELANAVVTYYEYDPKTCRMSITREREE